jgi:glycosyltransferase involved in cell wall biosynthesis
MSEPTATAGTVSACLIVRDEAQNLPLCLAALQPFVDEICVLDTGSADDSVTIAEQHGARVGHFEWCDDFAAARNACLELASSEWILTVDADELLDPESAEALPEWLANPEAQAWLVWIDNLVEAPSAGAAPLVRSVGIPRLFRRRPEIRYERRVHESIMESLIAMRAASPEPCGLRLVHTGYLPEVVRERGKRERNLAILEAEYARAPRDVFNAFKLASTYLTVEREHEALLLLRETWKHARDLSAGQRGRLPFLPLVSSELARLELRVGELTRARNAAEEGLRDAPHASELLYQRAEVERRAGRFDEARRFYVAARNANPWTDLFSGDPETRGVKAMVGLAKVSAMCGDLGLAGDALKEALELSSEDLTARTLAARLLAVSGDEQGSWTALGKLLDEAPGLGGVCLLAAEMAWSKGEVETAMGFWRGALSSAETRATAQAWLAIASLVAGDLEPGEADFATCDLPEAAARIVLGAVKGQPFMPDAQFERARLLEEVHAWLAELVRDPSRRALHAFQAGASALEAACPGITGILSSG